MAVAVGDDADAVTEVEGVVDDPLEGSPARMHLDRGLDGDVVGDADVGVASADMRKGDGVLAITLEGCEQFVGGVTVGGEVSVVGHQRV